MADGKQFVHTLNKLGYPNCSKLNGSDFDWMFDIPNLQPFLNWFCESLNEENVLTDNELNEYNQLIASPYIILEGELLEKCLRGLPQDNDDVPIEELRKEVAALDSHLKSNEAHLSLLRQQRDIFQDHQIELNHQLELLEDNELHTKHQLEHMNQKFIGLQKKVTNCLQSISLHMQDLTNAFKERSENNFSNGEMSCASFAYVDLHVYLKAEDKLLYQLKKYIKRHLNKQLVDYVDDGECELLDLSSNDSSICSEKSNKIIEQYKAEFSHLHKILQETEVCRVRELTAMAKQRGKVNFLETALHKNHFNVNNLQRSTLEHECKQLEQQIIKKQTELDELLTSALADVVEKAVQCRSSAVLIGDFESKLARQEVFLKKQEMILEMLLNQQARWTFFKLSFLTEANHVKETYKLLSELHSALEITWRKFCSRKEWMAKLQETKYAKKEIDSDDFTAHDIMNILEPYSDQKGTLFLTYSDLEQAAKCVNEERINLQSCISSSYADQMQKLTSLEECFNQWHHLAYGHDHLQSNSKPLMGPVDIDVELSKLNVKINILEDSLKDIAHDIKKKKKVLKENNYKAEERKLFVYFYTSPEKLQKAISNLLREVEGKENLQKSTEAVATNNTGLPSNCL